MSELPGDERVVCDWRCDLNGHVGVIMRLEEEYMEERKKTRKVEK